GLQWGCEGGLSHHPQGQALCVGNQHGAGDDRDESPADGGGQSGLVVRCIDGTDPPIRSPAGRGGNISSREVTMLLGWRKARPSKVTPRANARLESGQDRRRGVAAGGYWSRLG